METNLDDDLKAQIRKLRKLAWRNGYPRLYHVTGEEPARKILDDGFLDGATDGEATHPLFRGVWLSNRPLGYGEGVREGGIVLIVQFRIPLCRFSQFEVIEKGKTYREWVMPAAFIARHATTSTRNLKGVIQC